MVQALMYSMLTDSALWCVCVYNTDKWSMKGLSFAIIYVCQLNFMHMNKDPMDSYFEQVPLLKCLIGYLSQLAGKLGDAWSR